ncbi:Peptide ABC transporter permease [Hyphomicrobiales bacterium]|nr:Peptide ABC transporter permease [Hyphomicrobiales bacterium]CAH1696994.1 Peptide ABC transporter permease [Hyphomicrobiales bacterium]CAI0344932.1 Peptide ABC transporter permease [Hyphomicrobiales bacterium]
MIRHNAQAPLDPATDAALLLRRIGFGTLALVLPLAALVSRRAAVVLVPIGIALLIIAALIEEPGRFVGSLKEAVFSRPGLILLGILAWALLSLVWSPFPAAAAEKAGNLVLAVVLGFAGLSALPERMRSSNLNLSPLGTGSAGIFALGLITIAALRHAETPPGAVERGVSIILITAWPALAWLLSRERGMSALGLALVVALLALTRFEDGETVAMLFGTVAFGAVTASRERAAQVIATIVAGLMLFAPILPFLLAPLVSALPDSADDFAQMLSIWADVIRQSPVELITGHGLDTVVRDQLRGILPQPAPATLLFETWYELGLVGAAAAAACLYFAIRAAGRMPGALAAGGVAAFTTAFALAVFGFAPLLPWWLMTLTAVVLLFGAIARGQYRTDRPAVPLPMRPTGRARPKAGDPPTA